MRRLKRILLALASAAALVLSVAVPALLPLAGCKSELKIDPDAKPAYNVPAER